MMRMVHENTATGGHFSFRKAYAKAEQRWFWWSMRSELDLHIHTCQVCQRFQHRKGRHSRGKQWQPRIRPWHSVYTDAAGPFTTTKRGNKYILLLIDHFSR